MCKRFHFCECADQCPLRDAGINSYKKPVITLILKLKVLVICTKSALTLVETFESNFTLLKLP